MRVCEATYSPVVLEKEGFKFHAWQFEDGGIPPDSTVSSWLKLVHERFYSGSSNNNSSSGSNPNSPPSQSSSETPPPLSAATTPTRPSAGNNGSGSGGEPTTIAVHCVAGLGRAPVLVAVALIEAGLSPLDAIELIRRRRRGAFNSRQIAYVDSYKKQSKASSLLKNTFSRMFRRSQAWTRNIIGTRIIQTTNKTIMMYIIY